MKKLPPQIIPAQPGYYMVYDCRDEKKIELGEPIIAWRIETYEKTKGDLFSTCFPLTIEGDPCCDYIGIQNPDNTVTTLLEETYQSLAELQESRYK